MNTLSVGVLLVVVVVDRVVKTFGEPGEVERGFARPAEKDGWMGGSLLRCVSNIKVLYALRYPPHSPSLTTSLPRRYYYLSSRR